MNCEIHDHITLGASMAGPNKQNIPYFQKEFFSTPTCGQQLNYDAHKALYQNEEIHDLWV